MSTAEPVPLASDLCQLLTCLPEKFVVDFANGIDVGRDHLAVSHQRDGFFTRLYDGATGQGAQRQASINASLLDGMEGALIWLKDLSSSLALSNNTIAQIQHRVSDLTRDTARLADYSFQTRQALEMLSEALDERCSVLERQVARIGLDLQAQKHLDHVFGRWEVGRFNALSLSGRCYAVLEELRWGVFGDFCQALSGSDRQVLLESLANNVIIRLARDGNVAQGERRSTEHYWLARPAGQDLESDLFEGVRYLGDWSNPHDSPFIYAVSGQSDTLPLHMPRLGSAQRIAEGMTGEIFMARSK